MNVTHAFREQLLAMVLGANEDRVRALVAEVYPDADAIFAAGVEHGREEGRKEAEAQFAVNGRQHIANLEEKLALAQDDAKCAATQAQNERARACEAARAEGYELAMRELGQAAAEKAKMAEATRKRAEEETA